MEHRDKFREFCRRKVDAEIEGKEKLREMWSLSEKLDMFSHGQNGRSITTMHKEDIKLKVDMHITEYKRPEHPKGRHIEQKVDEK